MKKIQAGYKTEEWIKSMKAKRKGDWANQQPSPAIILFAISEPVSKTKVPRNNLMKG